jgi:glucarate dehydratase
MRITEAVVTPVAMKDPPLRNVNGVHQPFALRAVVQLRTDDGLVGLGETHGGKAVLDELRAAAPALVGLDPFDLNGLARVAGVRARGAFEVACWDLQGHATGRPVVDLLGGRVRDAVPYSGYLFFKYAGDDGWGEALTAEGIVDQARRMVDRYGFRSLKLKGGVLPAMSEVEVVLALREAFPDHPLRIDPNTGWTMDTSVQVAGRLAGTLEYLEDPVAGIPAMAELASKTEIPLATNMCVTAFEHLPPAVAAGAVQVVLADHHYWGGLRASLELAAVCRTFGLGLSMHSNSHLGISLAAMTHLAAAVPELTYACDTHYPYTIEDIVAPLSFVDGALPVPDGPGLGVMLDEDALARLAEQYDTCGFDTRDDVTPMRAIDPQWTPELPRW